MAIADNTEILLKRGDLVDLCTSITAYAFRPLTLSGEIKHMVSLRSGDRLLILNIDFPSVSIMNITVLYKGKVLFTSLMRHVLSSKQIFNYYMKKVAEVCAQKP